MGGHVPLGVLAHNVHTHGACACGEVARAGALTAPHKRDSEGGQLWAGDGDLSLGCGAPPGPVALVVHRGTAGGNRDLILEKRHI